MASNNRSIYSHGSGGEKPRIQFLAGLCFLWSSRKQSFLASSGFWWLLPFLFCGFISSVSACVFMWLPPLLPVCLSSVCVCLSLFFFFLLYNIVLVLPYINMNSPRVYMCSQSWTPSPTSLPIPSLWVILVHQPQATSIMHQTWTGYSFHIWYYTCFNAILPNHPALTLFHRVQKTVLYICVSFAVSYTRLSLPSF